MAQSKRILSSDEPSEITKIQRSADETLKHLFETGQASDLRVTLNFKDYLIHQVIVCPVIPFFDKMMSSNFKESQENCVTINQPINNEAFEWLIQWAYSFEKKINFKNVGDLLVASDFLQVEKVFHACCIYLSKILSVETALSIKEWIRLFDVGELNNKLTVYILENFKAIFKTKKWLNLSIECLTKYIEDGDAVGFDEYDIVEAILGWAEFDPNSRQEHLSALLGFIIWHDIDIYYICNYVASHELIKNNEACVELLMDVLRFKAFPDHKYSMFPYWRRMRIHKYKGEALMAFVKSSNNLLCFVKTPYSKEWEHWESFNNIKIQHSEKQLIIATDEFLYFHSEKKESSTDIFGKLSTKTLYKSSTVHPQTVTSSRDKIYIAESSDDSKRIIKFISNCDFQKSDWCELLVLCENFSDFGMVHLNDFLYFIGGSLGNSKSASAVNNRYNILESKWDILPSMSTPRFNPKVITLNDKIYVYGGTRARYGYGAQITLKSIECYDPKQQKWFDIPTPKSHIELLVPFNSMLYAFSDRKLGTVNIYDPKINIWTQEKEPEFKNSVISVVFIPNVQTL